MNVTPIKSYKAPDYPLLSSVKENPELLANIPKRWQALKPLIGAAIGFCLLNSNGCSTHKPETIYKSFTSLYPQALNQSNENNSKNLTSEYAIAPLFVRGKGVGVFGCVMVAGPEYLSEFDALQIIIGEFANRGVPLEIKKDSIARNTEYSYTVYSNLYSQKFNLSIVYINSESPSDYNVVSDDGMISIYGVNAILTAKDIVMHIDRKPKTNVVVFYDPLGDSPKDDLKAQIDDYFDWVVDKAD